MIGLFEMPRFMREHRWTRAHVSDYIDGLLAPAGAQRVHEHVDRCPRCRQLLASLQRTVAALGMLRERPGHDLADAVIDRLRGEH
jgi:anti-sigma factor RsiW